VIRWLGQLPAEVLFPAFVLAGIGLTYVFDLAMRRFVKPETRQRATATAAVTLQVTATIYAILIAFVIVDEYTQLRDTQSQISDKASSLSIMYESSRALPEPAGNKVRVATLDYARNVVTTGLPLLEHAAEPDIATDHAVERIYRVIRQIEPSGAAEQQAYDAIARSLDDVVSTRAQLINSARASLPTALFWMLVAIGVTVMSVATLLDTQHRSSHLFILSALALVIWLTLALVVSMDYPFGGIIRVTDRPIREFIQFRAAR
jgi:uncharacterized membrane protein